MEDLIYKFLIQAEFPRASIVTDITAVDHSAAPADASFVIVDPQNTDTLAVIKVVGPVNAETLIDQSSLLAVVAQRIGAQQTQGFVVRVDAKAKREAEQVQFYRCHPNTDLQQVSARTFPDFGSMKVNHMLMAPKPVALPQSVDLLDEEIVGPPKIPVGAILPGIVLLLLAVIDWGMRTFAGSALFDVPHTILFVGGAALLSLPALVRYCNAFIDR